MASKTTSFKESDNMTSVSTTAFILRPKNATEDSWPYEPIDPKEALLLLLITIVAVIMNVLALIATRRVELKYKGSLNNLITALGCLDLLYVTLIGLPLMIIYFKRRWIGGDALCQFQGFINNFLCYTTGGLTVALALDRLIAVTKPFLYRKVVGFGRSWLVVLAAVSLGLLVGVLPFFGFGRYVRSQTGTYCAIDTLAKSTMSRIGAAFCCFLATSMLFITIMCNIWIIFQLNIIRRKRGDLAKTFSDFPSHDLRRQMDYRQCKVERNLAFTVLVMTAGFLICYLPYNICILLSISGSTIDSKVQVTSARLVMLNSVINPFIYTFCRKKAKAEFCNIWKQFLSLVRAKCRKSPFQNKSAVMRNAEYNADLSK